MLSNFVEFVSQLLIKFVAKLPSNPFSWDQYTGTMSTLLGHLNYFIPFYLFKDIVSVWLVGFGGTLAIVIVIRAIRKGGIG